MSFADEVGQLAAPRIARETLIEATDERDHALGVVQSEGAPRLSVQGVRGTFALGIDSSEPLTGLGEVLGAEQGLAPQERGRVLQVVGARLGHDLERCGRRLQLPALEFALAQPEPCLAAQGEAVPPGQALEMGSGLVQPVQLEQRIRQSVAHVRRPIVPAVILQERLRLAHDLVVQVAFSETRDEAPGVLGIVSWFEEIFEGHRRRRDRRRRSGKGEDGDEEQRRVHGVLQDPVGGPWMGSGAAAGVVLGYRVLRFHGAAFAPCKPKTFGEPYGARPRRFQRFSLGPRTRRPKRRRAPGPSSPERIRTPRVGSLRATSRALPS